MPYFVDDSAAGCNGFATVKEDGEVIGCHTTKEAAIAQMVAVSLAEDLEPGGDYNERISPNLPAAYRPASSADVPANHNCGNCGYYKNFYCKRWDAFVAPAYYCAAWEEVEGIPNDNPGQTIQTGNISGEDAYYSAPFINMFRQLSFDVPVYIRSNARKGLDYYGKGLAGDGLVARTVREAREMAAGRISEDKVIRANAWGARHLADLEAPRNSDADNDQFPGPGAVAFYLWGINPLNPGPAMQWFKRQAERVKESEERELRKEQPRDRLGRFSSTGGGGIGAEQISGGPNNPRAGMGDIGINDNTAAEMASGSAGPHLIKNEQGQWEFTQERQALHDKIVSDAVDGVPTSANPTYYVMGGGPAAGKSSMLATGQVNVPQGKQATQVNADDVKTQLPEYKSMSSAGDLNAAAFSHEESSYLSKRIQSAGMERGTDVVLDGTGDSTAKSIGGKVDSARAQGYKVVGNYATVPTDVAIARANDRGRKTGRYVPETVIRQTHAGVSSVFPQVAGKFDEINLFDTTGRPRLIAKGGKGKLNIIDQAGYDSFLAKASE